MSPVLEELTELLGYSATMQLCLRHGGRVLYFPCFRPLVLDIPEETMHLLQERYQGDALTIPLAKRELAHWLVEDQNISITEAARVLRTSRASIRRWLAQQKCTQPSLFAGLE